jgi:hypothetical protein
LSLVLLLLNQQYSLLLRLQVSNSSGFCIICDVPIIIIIIIIIILFYFILCFNERQVKSWLGGCCLFGKSRFFVLGTATGYHNCGFYGFLSLFSYMVANTWRQMCLSKLECHWPLGFCRMSLGFLCGINTCLSLVNVVCCQV